MRSDAVSPPPTPDPEDHGTDEPSGARDRAGGDFRAPGWLPVAVVLGVVLLDQLTKTWAVRRLADGPVSVWSDAIVFQLGRNTGGAFSLFPSFTPILAVLAVVVAVFLARGATNR